MMRLTHHQSVNQISAGDQRSAQALAALTRSRRTTLINGLDFNEITTSFAVDNSGRVPIPSVFLAVTLPEVVEDLAVKFDPNDGKMYVWSRRNDDWFGSPVSKVDVATDVPFADMPEQFADWVSWDATAEFYAEHHGDPTQYIARMLVRSRGIALNTLPTKNTHAQSGYQQVLAAYWGGGVS